MIGGGQRQPFYFVLCLIHTTPLFFFVRHRCAACLLPLAVVVVPPAVVPPVADVPPVALLPLAEDKDVRRVARVTPVACPLPRTKT